MKNILPLLAMTVFAAVVLLVQLSCAPVAVVGTEPVYATPGVVAYHGVGFYGGAVGVGVAGWHGDYGYASGWRGSASWHDGSGSASGWRGGSASWSHGSGSAEGWRGSTASWSHGTGSISGFRGGSASWGGGSGSWHGAGGRSGSWRR